MKASTVNEPGEEQEKPKTGVIPDDQLSGSDADKAYDKDGNFEKLNPDSDGISNSDDSPKGSDADSES